MKRLVAVLLACLLAVLAAGCGAKPSGYTLRLTVSSWNGWEEDYQPKEETLEYELVWGKSYQVPDALMGDWQFKVAKVGDGEVTIKTEMPLAAEWSLGGEGETTFTLQLAQPVSLSTLTLDGGGVYHLELVETA